ncbi:MAG: universal stress protein [Bacteroidia bacterium]|nr:universal stress protein [Bacteroidia bacterium]
MKKILVPTDFSPVAIEAFETALALAARMQAEVHVLSCIAAPAGWENMPEEKRSGFPEVTTMAYEVQAELRQLLTTHKNHEEGIITSFAYGSLTDVMLRYVDREGIDLVVMGSKGAFGLREHLVGSNAQHVVNRMPCPVLVLKKRLHPDHLQHIVFASDFGPASMPSFRELIEFATLFDSHMHLLHVKAIEHEYQQEAEVQPDIAAFQRMCWRLPCTVHEFGDINVELGITHFATDTLADLVAVVHHGLTHKKKAFTSTITESLVNHLELPVLTFNTLVENSWYRVSLQEAEPKA